MTLKFSLDNWRISSFEHGKIITGHSKVSSVLNISVHSIFIPETCWANAHEIANLQPIKTENDLNILCEFLRSSFLINWLPFNKQNFLKMR